MDENNCIPNRKARKRKCEQDEQRMCRVGRPWTYIYAAVKKRLKEEKYVNNLGDRRGDRVSLVSEPDQQV